MTIEFATEELTDALWDEAVPLLAAHWVEVAHYKDIPLEPNQAMYRQAVANNSLRVFTARRDGKLVGYALYFVATNPHYMSSRNAVQDVVFLDVSVRGRPGLQFLSFCDDALRAEGIQVVYQHLKAAHDHRRLMEHLGYELMDVVYAKRLDVPHPIVPRGTSADLREILERDYMSRRWPEMETV